MLRQLAAGLWLIIPAAALAQEAESRIAPDAAAQVRQVQIPRIARPPVLEEFVSGNPRKDMKRIDDFRQRNPRDGVPVSYPTAAWLGYDDKQFYAVFQCKAPAREIRARMSKREDIQSDDLVLLLLDTFHDHQRSYEFFVNPLGVQADAFQTEGQGENFSFDTLWSSSGRLTEDGYAVMMSIPFRSLRFSSEDVQTWGVGLARLIPTNNENSFWPYVTRKVTGFNQQLGDLSGLEQISPGRNLQLTPYAAFGRSHYLDQPDPGVPSFRTKTDPRAGMDVKTVLRDSLTLDVALNPDFSQVESDDPQVTVNQRFEVMYPEKRPFFLENSGYFNTPTNLFFSRRISDPAWGARLTGKIGRWNLGVLGIDDRAPGDTTDDADPSQGKRAGIGVMRLQREFGSQSSVGLIVTDREFAGSYNRVGGLDTRLKLGKNWIMAAQAINSQNRDLDGNYSGGSAYNVGLFRFNRKYGYEVNYIDRAEGFHSELGFVPRVNIRQVDQFFTRRFFPESRILLSHGPRVFMSGGMDHNNVQTDWRFRPGWNFEMARATFIGVSHGQVFERYDGINFRRQDTGVGMHTEYFKRATFDVDYSIGTRINYDVPENVKPFLGDGSEVRAEFTFRPTNRMKIDQTYFLTRFRTRADSFPDAPTTDDGRPSAVFVNHLMRTKLNYQFTRELSLRFITDYNGNIQNAALTTSERQKRLTGDILLTYLVHPGTAFYVGYTNQRENLALFRGDPDYVERVPRPSVTTGRQLFVKASYLFRF